MQLMILLIPKVHGIYILYFNSIIQYIFQLIYNMIFYRVT